MIPAIVFCSNCSIWEGDFGRPINKTFKNSLSKRLLFRIFLSDLRKIYPIKGTFYWTSKINSVLVILGYRVFWKVVFSGKLSAKELSSGPRLSFIIRVERHSNSLCI